VQIQLWRHFIVNGWLIILHVQPLKTSHGFFDSQMCVAVELFYFYDQSHMSADSPTRFVTTENAIRESNAWTQNEWLCRPDLVEAEKLLCVRATMPAGGSHPFHRHPHREEIIYILSGQAEQWVGAEKKLLQAGDSAHIPAGMVHATYNPHAEPVVFLAILSPAQLPAAEAAVPDPEDVSSLAPWCHLRDGLPASLPVG
jgi:quercetin dioxygenase-like cupin family protein